METIKLKSKNYWKPVNFEYEGPFIYLTFGFDRFLMDEIKSMEGSHWCGYDDPPRKAWRIDATERNLFQLRYLAGDNPYARYDTDLEPYTPPVRHLYAHQRMMVAHILTRHYCELACEMGTGKTLAAIEAMEAVLDLDDPSDTAWYIGPRSGVRAVNRELLKWSSRVWPKMMTYERLTKTMETGLKKNEIPRFVVFDESIKLKTPTSQRAKAGKLLADAVRAEYGDNGYVVEMTGTPVTKSPLDWWHQCEIACPGFLKEGSIWKFRDTLAITKKETNLITGGNYSKIVGWRDSEDKCYECGEPESAPVHNLANIGFATMSGADAEKFHAFKPGVDELSRLYRRLQGLVLFQFAKDCSELPELIFETIQVKPTPSIVRTANIITKTTARAAMVLTLLRELSDGFQYEEVPCGEETCPSCFGKKTIMAPEQEAETNTEEVDGDFIVETEIKETSFELKETKCPRCNGTGQVTMYKRAAKRLECPKDDIIAEQLEEHEDVGRIVLWSGFIDSVDRLVDICIKHGWIALRVDGRGEVVVTNEFDDQPSITDMFDAMDGSHRNAKQLLEKYPKVAFVGNPQAGGMAYTLTAAPTAIYFSNSFDGGARMQSIKRIHRLGMDTRRGCRIIDVFHLPTDAFVLANLDKKRDLKNVTMGEVLEVMSTVVKEERLV